MADRIYKITKLNPARPNGDRFCITMVPADRPDAAPTWIGTHKSRKGATNIARLLPGWSGKVVTV
jgi:hypothetical protein